MATYNIPNLVFSAAEERGFDRILKQFNDHRAAQTPPLAAVTKNQYIQGYIAAIPGQWLAEFRADAKHRLGVAVDSMNDAALVNTMSAAGVDLNPYD